jgi:integrase
MANLYKKPVVVRDPKTGEKVTRWSAKWYGRFVDENGEEKRVALARDKMAAQTMLNERVKKVERRLAGLIDRFDEHRKRPIAEHLSDFEKHLKAKGNSPEQVKLVTMRSRRIVTACDIGFTQDLSASRVQGYLAELRETEGKSAQTSNHYLRSIKQFTRWLVKDRRAADDPLAHMAMLNVSTDRRHDRRPFSNDELTAIIQTANAGPVVRKMKGPDRAMLYAVAAYTGLRASELASLTVSSFELDGNPASVKVAAAYSKHRREDILPLHGSLVERLRPWLRYKPAGQLVWPGTWAKSKEAGVMLRADLDRARDAWIQEAVKANDEHEVKRREQSSYLAYRDADGRYADFHALRHTFITNMAKSGVSPKAAQSLARHSTIDLTMNVYTTLTVHDQASAIAFLPPIPALDGPVSQTSVLQATGTNGPHEVPPRVPRGAEIGAILPASIAYEPASNCTENAPVEVGVTSAESTEIPEENGTTRVALHETAPTCISGEAGIRTLGRASTTPVFKTGPFGRSGTSPGSGGRWPTASESSVIYQLGHLRG